jgi:hypothetical protein
VLRCQQWPLEHFLEKARDKTEKMNHFLGELRIPLQFVVTMDDDAIVEIFNTWKY